MSDNTLQLNVLKTRPHFEILNGLRGIAAIVVVIFHFMEIIIADFHHIAIAHGYLAVDFFFGLSGFVIAYAYDQRMGKMGFKTFIKLRLIRLHPLIIIGSILGLLTFLFDPFSNLNTLYNFKETAIYFITSFFLIPYPMMEERFFNLFNLNAPMWSLFWEYIAYVAYATILFRIGRKALIPLLILAAAGLFYVSTSAGNLLGGWSGGTFFHGFARISFSFLMGMFIYRSNWIIKNKLGFLGVGVLLLGAFFIPYVETWNWLIEPLILIVYFPVIIALGAGANLSSRLEKVNTIAGDISYPLYMTHYPFIWIFLSYVVANEPSMSELAWVIPVSTIFMIAVAYVVTYYVDTPIRRYLRGRIEAKANR